MKGNETFNTLVLFERMVYIPIDDICIYGFMFNEQEQVEICQSSYVILHGRLKDYIAYLVGMQEWTENGNSITDDQNYFVDKEGQIFNMYDDYIKNYCKQVYNTKPLGYTVIHNCHIENTSGTQADFVVSEEQYNKLKAEYGQD